MILGNPEQSSFLRQITGNIVVFMDLIGIQLIIRISKF
jgi:hypothetical protein